MKRRQDRAALLGLLAGLCLLAATLPATWTAAAINTACAERCRLAAPTGRWWRGTAELYVKSPATEHWLDLGTVAWRPSWPQGPGVAARLDQGEGAIHWTGHQLAVTLRAISVPADLVLAQPALRLPRIGWSGSITIDSPQLNWTPRGPAADGAVRWTSAATSALDDLPLGAFSARFAVRDGHATMTLAGAPGNALDARLELAVAAAGRLTAQGTVTATGEATTRLAPALRTFALPEGATGRYRIDLR